MTNPTPGPLAFCGIYCGACRSHKKGTCPGCRDNQKATWCAIRTCCLERGYTSCADCTDFLNLKECRKFNNIPAKIIGLLFDTDRYACIRRIREVGPQDFAAEMQSIGRMALRRNGKA